MGVRDRTRQCEGAEEGFSSGSAWESYVRRMAKNSLFARNGGDWLVAWHSPSAVPAGTPHEQNAFCVTADDRVRAHQQ